MSNGQPATSNEKSASMSEKHFEPSFGKLAYLALGHFITDLYPAFLPPLLPLLVEKFQLSFTRVGLLAMVMSFSASLTQPVFGHLSDKLGGRKMIIWGPVVSGLSFSLIGLAPHYSFLILLLILGGLGISSFHPEGAALTASISDQKRTLIMSIFMLGGTVGIGIGPFLILLIIVTLGLQWSFLACLPAFITAWLLHKHAPQFEKEPSVPVSSGTSFRPPANRKTFLFGILMAIVVLRVTVVGSLTTFLPIIQNLRGFSLVVAGSSFSVFMLCGALGGLIGGYLADRVGRKKIILASFIMIIPVFLAFLYWKGPIGFIILALLGFLFFLSEPPCIVLAQELIPQRARTASSLIMGTAWGLAGFGVLGTGALADAMGIEWSLRLLLLLPVGSLALSFLLPKK